MFSVFLATVSGAKIYPKMYQLKQQDVHLDEVPPFDLQMEL